MNHCRFNDSVDHKLFSQFVEPIFFFLGLFLKMNVSCQRAEGKKNFSLYAQSFGSINWITDSQKTWREISQSFVLFEMYIFFRASAYLL